MNSTTKKSCLNRYIWKLLNQSNSLESISLLKWNFYLFTVQHFRLWFEILKEWHHSKKQSLFDDWKIFKSLVCCVFRPVFGRKSPFLCFCMFMHVSEDFNAKMKILCRRSTISVGDLQGVCTGEQWFWQRAVKVTNSQSNCRNKVQSSTTEQH